MLLIVGGAGFVGSNILATIANSSSLPIVICDNLGTDGIKWKNIRGHRVEDIIKPEWIDDWLKHNIESLDTIIFAANCTDVANPEKCLHTHYHLPRLLWEKATAHQKRFFYFSSWETYGDGRLGFKEEEDPAYIAKLKPLHPRAWAQNQFDYFVTSEVEKGKKPAQWVGLKLFDTYGPNEYHKKEDCSDVLKIFNALRKDKTVTLPRSQRHDLPHGDFLRNRLWIGDCVTAIIWLLAEPQINGLFNLSSHEEYSFNDLAELIATALDIPYNITYVQDKDFHKNTPVFNRSDTHKLKSVHNYTQEPTSLENGVNLYLYNYLMASSMFR